MTHLLLLELLIALFACASAAPSLLSLRNSSVENCTASSITWTACPPGYDARLQCANFSVPIDWDTPQGEHFNLGLIKLPAAPTNISGPKVGKLFINPGGPGGSAVEVVQYIAKGFLNNAEFPARFDLIGMDPRGVGLSNQVKCDKSIYLERVSLFPQTETDFEKLIDKNRRLGESCLNMTGPLLGYIDTISVVKDQEAVRIALGDEPLNFWGLSYGSQLGAQYAALFPNKIRTLALDGVLQHSKSETDNLLVEATSYEHTLMRFFKWASTNETSSLEGQNVEQLWTSLLANATRTSIPAPNCGDKCRSDVNAEEIRFRAQDYLSAYGKGWQNLASALRNATQGDGTGLSASLGSDFGYIAIGCLDWSHTDTSLQSTLNRQELVSKYAPLTRGATGMWALQHGCLGWPIPVRNPPKKLDVKTKATVLLVTSTGDPSTGEPWAVGMLDEIRNAVLVVREGNGHTSRYSFETNGATAAIVTKYLTTGEAPEHNIITNS